jgi:hypothetical protein
MNPTSNNPGTENAPYTGKIMEIISYIDHPIISINNLTIIYTGKRDAPVPYKGDPTIEKHVLVDIFYTFTLQTIHNKNLNFEWTAGTGEAPRPLHIITVDGCYSLEINSSLVLTDGNTIQDTEGKLRLTKVSNDECDNTFAKDLR